MVKEKLYFIPGLMCDERLWSRMTPYLEEKYDLVFLKIPHTTNFDEMNNILNEQIKEENITIVGFSLGGFVSLYYSLKNPNKVSKIFLVAASGSVSSSKEIERRRQGMIAARQLEFTAPPKDKIATLVDENSNEETIQIIQDMFIDLGRDVFETQLQATFNRVNLNEDIKNDEKSLNIIYGDNDRLVDIKWLEDLKENRSKNIKFESIKTRSHNIPLDFPKQVASFILEN